MTVYQFSDPVCRSIVDNTPIIFEWHRAGVEPVVSVAFDNTTFQAVSGEVSEITADPSIPRYSLSYSANDRLSSPGIITYRIAEGGDTAYLELRLTPGNQLVEVADTSTLATLIEQLGPRRVKTKDMEIEAHPIDKMQKIMERNSQKPIGLGRMRHDIVVPKGSRNRWCE